MAAHINHRVNGTGTTQGFTPWLVTAPVTQAGLGDGLVGIVEVRRGHRNNHAEGHVDRHRTVGGTKFHQRNAHLRILAQSIGQHRTGRAAANNDEIKFHTRLLLCWSIDHSGYFAVKASLPIHHIRAMVYTLSSWYR